MKKVLMALSVAGATVFGANAQEFGLGQPQAPSPNEIVMPAPVQPMPSPSIDGWVRPIPVPDNPGISGGIRAGDISVQGTIREHNGDVKITMPNPFTN